jgi:pimeloyl-ACP methyl ester carboxylesterase
VKTTFRNSVALWGLAAGLVMLGDWTAAAQPAVTAPTQPFPGKCSSYNGCQRYDFVVDGCPTIVVVPRQAAAGAPWIWRAEFFDAFPQVDLALLAKGFHLVYINVGNTFGCPDALKHWDALYGELTGKHGLARKAVLEGLSRGGLYCFNWAADHPQNVACILADNAVLDFKSWPGGKGKGKGSPGDWKKLRADYHFTSEAQAVSYGKNPLDNLEPLAKAKVPLFLLCADADDVVPLLENGAIVKQRYEKLGGPVTLLIKQGLGHHPHGLADPSPAVEFILAHTLPPGAPVVTTLEEQARPADAFVDSIGVNVHLTYMDTSYRNFAEVIKPRLREAGIRHVRDGCPPAWNKECMTSLNELAAAGVRSLLICSPRCGTLEQMVATLKQASASVEAVEGPNEPDGAGISYRDHGFPQAVRDFHDDLDAALKRDPATRRLPLVVASMSNPESAPKLGLLTSGDFANTHSYADGGPPGFRWDWYLERCRRNCQRPVMATETGYHNAPNHTDGLWIPGISQAAAGRYLSRLLPEYFSRGIVRTYLYELLDLRDNPRDAESNFGILRADGTPKPAFIAVKNLIAILADPGPPFTPGVLGVKLSGQQRPLRHLLLQKRDGRFELLLWMNVPAYDIKAKHDLDVPPQPVVVHFARPIRAAKAFLPLQGAGEVREFPATDRLEVEVPDQLLVLEITP